MQGVVENAGAEVPGLDDEDVDPERRELDPERLADRLERLLRRRVETIEGCRKPGTHRRDVDDHPGSLPSHRREDRPDQAERTEEIAVEHGARNVVVDLLDRRNDDPSGVVHEHVEAVRGRGHGSQRSGDRLLVGDVELQNGDREPTVVAGTLETLRAGRVVHGREHMCTSLGEPHGSRQPDPAVATRHQRLGHGGMVPRRCRQLTARREHRLSGQRKGR